MAITACAKCETEIEITNLNPDEAGDYLCDGCADRQEQMNRAHRTQGQYFSADAEKIEAVQVILTTENSTADAADWMVNYDWPNAEDHQEWLDSAPASEIASWILTSDK